ncbi:MAG: GatB/YqeY domain-containing protein [Candidatus Nanopelagicales bacterium]|nr:GatB/YqeY domain-containing protein [Candidatus Nanopelagicales bacterium]MCF8551363.1 GatB/YqeY domain-containing protein [Candidatus Nanopelagicales bacterium]
MSADQIAPLKAQLQADLTAAIKSRNELASSTLRMVLTAVTNEEVSGKEVRVLSNEDVLTVLTREAKKRKESAAAYADAQRPELADRENAELAVITAYLPEQISEEELNAIVAAAVATVAESGTTGGAALGAVMKIVQPQVKGRADGGAVAAKVKAALA